MAIEQPLFNIDHSIIDNARNDAGSPDCVTISDNHMRTYQPHLFSMYRKTAESYGISQDHYEAGASFMYNVWRNAGDALPINISDTEISEDLLFGHAVKVNEIFDDAGWEKNAWIFKQINQLPIRRGLEASIPVIDNENKHTELFNFFERLRSISEDLAQTVYDTLHTFRIPSEKKSFLRGIFDIFNPYYALVDAQSLSDKMWVLDNQKGLSQLRNRSSKSDEDMINLDKVVDAVESELIQDSLGNVIERHKSEDLDHRTSVEDVMKWVQDSLD